LPDDRKPIVGRTHRDDEGNSTDDHRQDPRDANRHGFPRREWWLPAQGRAGFAMGDKTRPMLHRADRFRQISFRPRRDAEGSTMTIKHLLELILNIGPAYWPLLPLRDDGHDILCHLLTTLSGTVGGGIERDAPSRVSIAWQIDAE